CSPLCGKARRHLGRIGTTEFSTARNPTIIVEGRQLESKQPELICSLLSSALLSAQHPCWSTYRETMCALTWSIFCRDGIPVWRADIAAYDVSTPKLVWSDPIYKSVGDNPIAMSGTIAARTPIQRRRMSAAHEIQMRYSPSLTNFADEQ